MLSFVGLRIAAFGQPITSNGVKRILVGPVIVRFPPTPLAICSTPSIQSPITNPTLAPSSSACLRAVSHPPPHLPLPSSASLGATCPASTPKPICISALAHSPPRGTCLCVSESTNMPLLPVCIEADFDIFPKLHHEELIKPARRYGAGIAPVKHKAEIVDIDDDDCPSGWECSFLDEYLPRGEEEEKDEKEDQEEEEEEGWEEKLLGVHVVDGML